MEPVGELDQDDPKRAQVALLATADGNAVVQRNHRRRGNDPRHLLQHRVHVIDGQQIGGHVALRSALVFGIDQVGPNRLNLVQHVLLARHPDGDHQNQRSRANHHAQRRQRETHLVAAESVVGKAENLPQD